MSEIRFYQFFLCKHRRKDLYTQTTDLYLISFWLLFHLLNCILVLLSKLYSVLIKKNISSRNKRYVYEVLTYKYKNRESCTSYMPFVFLSLNVEGLQLGTKCVTDEIETTSNVECVHQRELFYSFWGELFASIAAIASSDRKISN